MLLIFQEPKERKATNAALLESKKASSKVHLV